MAEFNIKQFKVRSAEYRVAELLLEGKSREDVIKHFFSWVGKREPFVYRENIGGGRRQKPMDDQYRLYLYKINQTITAMAQAGWENPETFGEKNKWKSKEAHWVRFRKKYIQDLLDQGFADGNNGLIPKPGTVSPVDPDGRPLKKKSGDIPNPIFKQDDLEEMHQLLVEDGLFDWDEIDEDDDSGIETGIEHTPSGTAIAEWEKKDGKWTRTKKVENVNGKYEDQFEGLVAELVDPDPEPDPAPVVYKAPTRAELIDDFYKRMMLARDFVMSREIGGEYLDFVSTRALKDGAKGIAYGLHPDEVMQAVTKTWSEDSKREFVRHERVWTPKAPSVNTKNYELPFEGAHHYLGYVMVLAKARIPIFLVGPSGCGKSFMARDLADAIEFEYGELPLTAGATPSWLVGAETITGYKSRPFIEIYRDGGVFCFEEMDAADPNMLLLVNNALANESFTNPVTGEEVIKSKNFVPVATANTWGLGANRQYTGRERLDAATLDRWRVGRVEMDYDQSVEKMIIKDLKKLADKRQAKDKPKKAVK